MLQWKSEQPFLNCSRTFKGSKRLALIPKSKVYSAWAMIFDTWGRSRLFPKEQVLGGSGRILYYSTLLYSTILYCIVLFMWCLGPFQGVIRGLGCAKCVPGARCFGLAKRPSKAAGKGRAQPGPPKYLTISYVVCIYVFYMWIQILEVYEQNKIIAFRPKQGLYRP